MSETSSDDIIWYPNSAYHRTGSSSESSESIDSISERTALLSETDRTSNTFDHKSPVIVDEEATRSQDVDENNQPLLTEQPAKSVFAVIGLLLIGVFVASADSSLVLATFGTISSEFNAFGNASWLSTSFILASCATQPLTGKLSDIYGRKAIVLISYVLFAVGCLICGLGTAFWQVVAGRIISGVGASGMTVLVSIIITDLVPLIQVASWRAYVNLVATLGRSIGGPLGGWLADTIGWRWSFIGQGPLISLAIVLVAYKLPSKQASAEANVQKKGQPSKLRRIDFVGAFILALAIVSLLAALSLGGQELLWSHPFVVGSGLTSVVAGGIFVLWETKYAFDPVFPPALLAQRDVVTSYAVSALQMAAQGSMMYSVPLFFKATQNSSNTVAGSHLFPAVVGNAVGGLITGLTINKTGKYKWLAVFSTVSSSISYTLLILNWNENITLWQSLEIIPGGAGNGIALASTFMGLTSSIRTSEIAMATAGFYLSQSIAMVIGLAACSAVQMGSLNVLLEKGLVGYPNAREIIDEAISNVGSIAKLEPGLKKLVIGSYVKSLEYSHGVSLGASLLAFVLALTIREHKLR